MAGSHSWRFARPVGHLVLEGRVVGTRYRIDDGDRSLDVYDLWLWLWPWQRRGVRYRRIGEAAL